jgi:hypothetical protein
VGGVRPAAPLGGRGAGARGQSPPVIKSSARRRHAHRPANQGPGLPTPCGRCGLLPRPGPQLHPPIRGICFLHAHMASTSLVPIFLALSALPLTCR